MNNFFAEMPSFEILFWIVAIIGTAVFSILFILAFLGGDMDSDVDVEGEFDADDGGGGVQFFTFKGVMAFFTIFGWTGLSCISYDLSKSLTLVIAFLAGLLMMILISLLFYWIHKLAESGTLKINKAVGTLCEVYIPIGANRSRIGKVQIKVQGSLRELDAITDHDEELKTSSIVKVVEVVSAELLLVEKISNTY